MGSSGRNRRTALCEGGPTSRTIGLMQPVKHPVVSPEVLKADGEGEDGDRSQVQTSGILRWSLPQVGADPGQAASQPTPTPLPLGANMQERYHRLRVLGKGGMGEVHLCKDEIIGRDVAMKIVLERQGYPQDAKLRFLHEAQVQGQLQHPSIVPVYDIGVLPDGNLFFTMKRLHGRPLDQILDALRINDPDTLARYPQHRLLRAFASVCIALDYAHARGVIHRDLKPAKVSSVEKSHDFSPLPS